MDRADPDHPRLGPRHRPARQRRGRRPRRVARPRPSPPPTPAHRSPLTVADSVGGAFRPQHTDVLPLRTDHDTDPLRALLAAGATVTAGEHACVQVLARPATARRVAWPASSLHRNHILTRRHTSSTPRRGCSSHRDVATGPPRPRTTPQHPPGCATRRRCGTRSVTPIGAKRSRKRCGCRTSRSECASPSPPNRPDAALTGTTAPPVDRRLTGLAHAIAAAAAIYTGRNRLRRLRMPHPVAMLAARRLRPGS